MPEKNIDFGKFGASGIKGSEAVARQLDWLAAHIATPVTARRGLMARLHYLTTSDRAWQAAKDAGLTVSDRTLKAWLEDKRRPSKANLERIDAAYRAVRRRNVARHLTARLNRKGRGTRVEIHPLDQSGVARQLQRVVAHRTMNVRRWDKIVASWAAGDHQGLDDAWTADVLPDLGSQWGQYEYVKNIGFAA
ncbi:MULTISPECIES: transcriptional regulator [Streptomyces]|uniref:Transcriptional regulator n=1 Tax=Streptomyces salinarius TaxID=2762598 RepID=A0ABW8BPX1_9ACTN|nr:transcriptional regulator [Streptomyces tendae]